MTAGSSFAPTLLLLYGQRTAGRDVFHHLADAARPFHRQSIHRSRCAEPEVQARIVLREVARAGSPFANLAVPAGDHFDAGADAVADALTAHQLDGNPVIAARRD